MIIELQGRARIVGDDINADYIITSSRKRETIDSSVLRQYLLEVVDPTFAASVRDGDLLVAGRNFGCGSAMEVAATVILAAGIKAVLARSFSRTFYRNAINNGLLPVECDTSRIGEGDLLGVRLADGRLEVRNLTRGETLAGGTVPPTMLAILQCGGLVETVRRYGSLRALATGR
ncbi:MAG TPA: 3-isopropylmalate dehydratase [Gemmatimonadaceae bacterium]|nr:3-isopropylmalate dehydratase [Gemmatimonadaceae bacterium]